MLKKHICPNCGLEFYCLIRDSVCFKWKDNYLKCYCPECSKIWNMKMIDEPRYLDCKFTTLKEAMIESLLR